MLMSKQLKKWEIKADGKTVIRQPQVVIIGFDRETQEIQMNIQGKISFEEMIDMFNTAQYELLATFFNEASKSEGVNEKELRRDIYNRAVLGFSLMIDKFDPEAKDDKFAGLTNEAIMEAQNQVLRKRANAKK